MDVFGIIEELSKEYGSLTLLAAYIKRTTNCSISDADDRAYHFDMVFEQMLEEYNDEE